MSFAVTGRRTRRKKSAVDLAGLVVALAGRLVPTRDRWEPYRLLDSRGVAVEAAGRAITVQELVDLYRTARRTAAGS